MKCPSCNAPTLVLSTRTRPYGKVRTYECYNFHRFQTTEKVTESKRPLKPRSKL